MQLRGAPKNKKHSYKGSFWSDEELASLALDWRKKSGEHNDPRFDILAFYRSFVIGKTFGTKGRLCIKTIVEEAAGRPAYVRFDPFALHIKESILEEAWGDPQARFIMAHELGHIILHDKNLKEFSTEEERRSSNEMDNWDTEWHADTFARHFLIPLHIAKSFRSVEDLAIHTQSPLSWALKQFDAVNAPDRYRRAEIVAEIKLQLTGDLCTDCGNFTLMRSGVDLTCGKCRTIRRA